MSRALWLCLVAAAVPQADQPAFEVASVKVAKLDNGPLRVTAPDGPDGINYTNVTLQNCIRRAYGVRTDQITGGPAWLTTERFLISAKAGRAVPHDQLMLMLRHLLEDRFHLAVRHDRREVPVYELTVTKGGIKAKPSKPDAEMQIDGNAQHPFIATAVSMQSLAGALRVDRPVFDETGLTGLYDITLDYARDDPFGVFLALQQVGLKLEPRKRMLDVLVVDHAEMPTEN